MTPTAGVPVELDGEKSLRYDMRAFLAVERRTKKSLINGAFDMSNLFLEDIVVLLWAGLLHEDPSLTFDAVLDLVDPGDIQKYAEAIGEAFKAAWPQANGTGPKAKARPKAKRSSG